MSSSVHALRRTALAAAFIAANATVATAYAEQSEALDNLSISIGDYIVRPNASVSTNTRFGTASSGEISSHEINIPRVKADFLLGNSQGFALDYYGFYRKYSDNLNRTFSAGDSSATVTGNASGHVGLDLANASYKWWFGQGSDVIGVGVGAAYYRIHFGVDGAIANTVDNGSSVGNASYSADAVAPLLQIGWRHAFSPSARMYVDLSGIEKGGGNLHGHIYNGAIGAEWYFTQHIGVGVEYSATRVKVDSDGDDGKLNLKMDGPTVFLKARF